LREHKHHTHTTTIQNKHAFYKFTENLTHVAFADSEIQLLNKDLKYNLHHKQRNRLPTLAIEADTTINFLPEKDQSYMKQLVANNIQKLINKQKTSKDQRTTTHTKRESHEWNTLKSIKQNKSESACSNKS
jgi:hypothetical protein